MLPVANTTVSMSNIGDVIDTGEDGNLCETIIVSIKGLVLKSSNNVVSDNSNLVPASPESLSGRKIADITKTEDVLMHTVLEGLVINVQ